MSSSADCVWNPNAIDKSCLPMRNRKKSKTSFCSRFYLPIIIAILLLIPSIILTVISITQYKHSSVILITNTSNTSTIEEAQNVSIKGLLTMETAVQANICEKDDKLEDCVLIYNAKIIMNILTLASPRVSDSSLLSSNLPENTLQDTSHCKALQIRRSQLSQIFEPNTLEILYKLSGITYTPTSSDRTEERSQIDARSVTNRWSSPISFYINVDSGLTPVMAANIRTAVSNWQSNTVLTFNEITVITPTLNKSYISFRRDDDYGCSSPVGYDPTDPTSVILISAYCSNIIVSIMHEIGHTLGFIHTQSRIDRDTYITVVTANILPDYAANFFKWAYGTIRFLDVDTPYDYGSFMHYDGYGFTNNGAATIIPLDTRYDRTIGQREVAAFYDYKQINRLYFNRAACPFMFASNGCQNNGYLDPKTCSRCVCPDGFSGTNCDQRDSASNCGDVITNPTPYSSAQVIIQNPTPTSTTPVSQYCVYHIKSSSARKIRLQLNAISTIARAPCSVTSMFEVKFQSDMALTGARWCGVTVPTVWLNITAENNTMVVMFRSNNYINATTRTAQARFVATIYFDPEPAPGTNQSIPITAASTASTSTTKAATISSTISTTIAPQILTATTSTTTVSTCPSASFRCQLATQPTCGGCLSYQPCSGQATQQCTAYSYQAQLTDCDKIINGIAQCRYQFILTPYITYCQHSIVLCCPNYQLISYQAQYFCIYNTQAINPTDWSAII